MEENPESYPEFKIAKDNLSKYIPFNSPLQSSENVWKCIVPKSQRKQIIQSCHDPPQYSHFGIYKTLSRVQENYYFPKMRCDILRFVKSCIACQSKKTANTARMGLMVNVKQVHIPFQIIAIDIMGPFPRSPQG